MFTLRRFSHRHFSLWPLGILALALLCWHLGTGRRLAPWRGLQRSTAAAARALQGAACQHDADALRAHVAAHHAPACALENLPPAPRGLVGGGGAGRAVGPPLHIFLRVSAAERSWSGAGRFLGWGKAETALATAYSLRVALELLEGAQAPPRAVNVTILYDGLQEDRLRQKSWVAAMNAIFLAGRPRGLGGGAAPTLFHVAVPPGDSGNRGTNLLQFRLAREVACAPPPPQQQQQQQQQYHHHQASAGAAGAGAGGKAPGAAAPGGAADAAAGSGAAAGAAGAAAAAAAAAGGAAGSGGEALHDAGDALVYFVEDDYIHAPSALAELVDVLTLPALDGAPPPAFATLTDYPDRLTFGAADLGAGAATITGSTRRHWRTLPSTTMSFAARCSELQRALPVMQAAAPHDQDMWHSLLWWRGLGVYLGQRSERLLGPMPSLAIHATDTFYSFYAPPLEAWGGGGERRVTMASWCGLATCLRDSARQLLATHAPATLALMQLASDGKASRAPT